MVCGDTSRHEEDVHEAIFSCLSRSVPCKPIAVNPLSSFGLPPTAVTHHRCNHVKSIQFEKAASLIQGVMLLDMSKQ